jgi:hypothetical protein
MAIRAREAAGAAKTERPMNISARRPPTAPSTVASSCNRRGTRAVPQDRCRLRSPTDITPAAGDHMGREVS